MKRLVFSLCLGGLALAGLGGAASAKSSRSGNWQCVYDKTNNGCGTVVVPPGPSLFLRPLPSGIALAVLFLPPGRPAQAETALPVPTVLSFPNGVRLALQADQTIKGLAGRFLSGQEGADALNELIVSPQVSVTDQNGKNWTISTLGALGAVKFIKDTNN